MTERFYSTATVLILVAALCFALPTTSEARVTEPDSTSVIIPGISYAQYLEKMPWAVQVITIERSAWNNLGVTLGGPTVLGIEPLDRTIKRLIATAPPIEAAVNGDFYQLADGPFQGDPIGLCVTNGELVSSPINRSAFIIREDGSITIGRYSFEAVVGDSQGNTYPLDGVNQHCPDDGIVLLTPRFNNVTRPEEGSTILVAGPLDEPLKPQGTYRFTVQDKMSGTTETQISQNRILLLGKGKGAAFLESFEKGRDITCAYGMYPDPGRIRHAVGGGPRLMRNGMIIIEAGREGIGESFVTTRHPRTALGYDNNKLYLVTIDGRREGYSVGMSLPETAEVLLKLGAEDAINLDGGGSTTCWADGQIRNRPSDNRVRPIANAIVIYGSDK